MPGDQQQVHCLLLQGSSSGDEVLEAEAQPAFGALTQAEIHERGSRF